MNDRQWLYAAYALAGLSTLFVGEGMSFLCMCWDSKGSGPPVSVAMNRRLSCSLILIILVVQMIKNYWIATGKGIWIHSIQPSQDLFPQFRPVFSIHYVEWMVTVPLMLVLSGICVLGRSFSEVVVPIAATDTYIFVAWAANLVQSAGLQWLLITTTFVLYGWASIGMFRWVSNFWLSDSKDLPRPEIRAAIALGLVLLFSFYGLVYLLARLDAIDLVSEHLCYTFLDVSSKIAMSLILSRVQAADQRETMESMVKYIGNLNVGMMSILRANFDYVVPCVADSNGCCRVQSLGSGDIRDLGHVLGRDVTGLGLSELIAPEDQDNFASYVQNSLDQALKVQSLDAHMVQSSQKAPVASVVQCNMLSWARSRSREDNKSVEDGTQGPPHRIPVIVHLSVVRYAGPQKIAHVIAAFQLCNESSLEKRAAAGGMCTHTNKYGQDGREKVLQESSEYTVMPFDSASNATESPRSKCGTPTDSRSSGEALTGIDTDEPVSVQNSSQKGSTTSTVSSLHSLATPHYASGLDIEVGRMELGHVKHVLCDGSDVGSQSSKFSAPGSVTSAFRKVLGPLHTGLPPDHLMPKAVEDYMQCAADMVRRKVPVEISRLHHQQRLAEWTAKKQAHSLSEVLVHGRAPDDNIDEHIWRSLVLPAVSEAPPGKQPKEPDLPDNNELWQRSWNAVFEEDDDDEDSEEEVMGTRMAHSLAWQNYPARHVQAGRSNPFLTF
jgi:bacteriorhodopsin